MTAKDPHQFVNELDEAAIEGLISRLEKRAKDKVFTDLFDKYAARLALAPSARVLEVGCGTGAMMRSLAKRHDFSGTAIGVDQCPQFIEAANNFASSESLDDRVEFYVGDAHNLEFDTGTFDAVIANTLISHVTDPKAVIGEMARIVRPGGTVVIFDGDYSSLTYGFPDHEFGQKMDNALASVTFNNPLIMHDLPRIFPEFDLTVTQAWGDAMVEIGSGSYFKSFAETYVPYVLKDGSLPEEAVKAWLASQIQMIEQGTFFASCTYYTYLTHRV